MINTLLGLVNKPLQSNENSSVLEDVADNHLQDQQKLPTLSYTIQERAILMNNWESPYYFTAAFSTLFPNGIGGHQD